MRIDQTTALPRHITNLGNFMTIGFTWYYEPRLADLLGLQREELQFVRDEILEKKAGADWRREGREIVLSAAALQKVLEFLAKGSPDSNHDALDFTSALVADPEKKEVAATEPSAPPAIEEQLTVERLYPNPRLLLAKNKEGEMVRVRVPNNLNFRRAMKLTALLVEPGVYQLKGRCPRYPGRY